MATDAGKLGWRLMWCGKLTWYIVTRHLNISGWKCSEILYVYSDKINTDEYECQIMGTACE